MLDMFSNYQKLSEKYTPNNLSCKFPEAIAESKLSPLAVSKPYELYNAKDELEGYFWRYGDYITLEFQITGELTLDDGTETGTYIDAGEFLNNKSIILTIYNFRFEPIIVERTGSALISVRKTPDEADDINFIDAGTAFSDSSINERTEPAAYLHIGSELSKKLPKGIYYCSLEVDGDGFHQMLFGPEDCKLLVK